MRDILPIEAIMPDLIRPDFIKASLVGENKESLIPEMVALAENTGLLRDRAALLSSLLARESEGSTAVSGCAFLHPKTSRSDDVSSSFIVLGRTPRPIPFGALDGIAVDVFFALCCQTAAIYHQTLVRVSQMILKTGLLDRLRRASDNVAMYQAILACERELLK